MTSATKRKHVIKEMLDDFSVPKDHQRIVKVIRSPGSNLHEVLAPDGNRVLCSLPVKFRKNIWIKRGDFVVIESIHEGDKVKAEIVRILYPQHVKSLQKDGNWPERFCSQVKSGMVHEEDLVKKEKLVVGNANASSAMCKNDRIHSMNNGAKGDTTEGDYSSDDSEDSSDIPANTNRPVVLYEEDTSSDSD